jgi:hypothetical protein
VTNALRLSLALLLLAAPIEAQEERPYPAAAEAADRLEVARAADAEGEAARALRLLDELVAWAAGLRGEGAWPVELRAPLAQAFELRGRLALRAGQREKAASSLTELLRLRPAFTTAAGDDARFAALLRRLRDRHVGRLQVRTTPPGAQVLLDGEPMLGSDAEPVSVFEGAHTVETSRVDHLPASAALTVIAGRLESVDLALVRTHASVFVVTDPPGVEVLVDGRLRATTAGRAAGEAPETIPAGLDPERVSTRTEITGIPVGQVTIELRRECFEPTRRVIEVPEPGDYELAPIRLAESVGSLNVLSDPPGAQILLDGRPAGISPRVLDRVCSGRRRLEVRHARGRYVRELELPRGEALTLECPARPTLAFLGTLGTGSDTEHDEGWLLDRLSALATVNVVRVPRERVETALDAARLRLVDVAARGAGSEEIARAGARLAQALECHGFLLIDRSEAAAHLVLRAAGSPLAESWPVVAGDPASLALAVLALERAPSPFRPWTGIVAVDTLLPGGPRVVRVAAGSPAERAGVGEGETILAMDGRPITGVADMRARLAARRIGTATAIEVRGAAGSRTLSLEVGRAATAEAPPTAGGANRAIIELLHHVESGPPEMVGVARLNLALATLALGDAAGAHEQLLLASGELPERRGISRGTALYHLARVLERLSLPTEAAEAYARAAADREATLGDDDGPRVGDVVPASLLGGGKH